jgi:hypothetical protein
MFSLGCMCTVYAEAQSGESISACRVSKDFLIIVLNPIAVFYNWRNSFSRHSGQQVHGEEGGKGRFRALQVLWCAILGEICK